MTRLAIALVAAALLCASSFWAGVRWEQGRQAERDLAASAAEDARRRATATQEAERLAAEQRLAVQFGEVINATYVDPDAGLLSLGLRDSQRLNAVR